MKKTLALVLALVMALGLVACGGTPASTPAASTPAATNAEKEDIALRMWGAEEDQTMLRAMADAFIAQHADVANITIELGSESEATAKDTILTDVEAAADVFAFADDQVNELIAAGALQEVTDIEGRLSLADVKGRNVAGSIDAASGGDKLYAFPMTADNGYFMFYNKEFISAEDAKTMDGILAAAEKAGKKATMNLADGWYLYSFFAGAGLSLDLNADGLTNTCDWNSTTNAIPGVDVTQGVLDIASNKSFIPLNDEAFVAGVKDGSLVAGVSGVWNANVAEETWGENYAACKLPTFTVAGDQVQMGSFAGYKLIGVNPHCENVGWAMLLADFITNEENQVTRFEIRGLGPSNIAAAGSEAVQASPAIAALAEQAGFATVQRVGGAYWSPAQTFGAILSSGNETNEDLQVLLDTLVEGVIAPVG